MVTFFMNLKEHSREFELTGCWFEFKTRKVSGRLREVADRK